MCSGGSSPAPAPPPPVPVIDNSALIKQQEESNKRMVEMEARAAAQREADLKRQQEQFTLSMRQQEQQYQATLAAQNNALQRQIAAQQDAQRKAEEAALRGQVPQLTANSKNAQRVKSKSSSRSAARQAAMGTSQLRVPLSIQGSTAGGGSPVKLNIGS